MKFTSLLKSMRQQRTRLGFTMIELLVVVAILGILASTVIAALNPVEQIARGRDTRTRSDAAQLLSGAERFYASNQLYPWNVTNGTVYTTANVSPTALFVGGSVTTTATAVPSNAYQWGRIMETRGELKSGLISRIAGGSYVPKIQIWKTLDTGGVSSTLYACFAPTSFQFKQEAANDCNDGTVPGSHIAGAPLVAGGAQDPCPTPGGTGSVTAGDASLYLCLP